MAAELVSVEGRTLGHATWSKEALEAKYGKPKETHVGGFEPDANRDIPDKPAEDVLQEKRQREAAEQKDGRVDEDPDGSYRKTTDPPGVRRAPDGEAMIQDRDGNWTRVTEMPRRDNVYTGRWGETVADRYAAGKGWEKLNGPATTMESGFTGPRRIDAVYYNPKPPPGPYIVSDAKVLGSKQGTTKDKVLQMSAPWIEERLPKARLTRQHMDRISDGYTPVLLRVDKNGKVTPEWLDEAGNVIETPQEWR